MVEQGTIYWCQLCEVMLRFESECQTCFNEAKPCGWMITNE